VLEPGEAEGGKRLIYLKEILGTLWKSESKLQSVYLMQIIYKLHVPAHRCP
jgi:hypothetical protein